MTGALNILTYVHRKADGRHCQRRGTLLVVKPRIPRHQKPLHRYAGRRQAHPKVPKLSYHQWVLMKDCKQQQA